MAMSSIFTEYDIQEEGKAVHSRVESADKCTWKPLNDEINRLMDTLCELYDNKAKSMNIITDHTERIKNAIPQQPDKQNYAFQVFARTKRRDTWDCAPIHQLLSVRPLKGIEIPLDVLKVLVSSVFDVSDHIEYCGETYEKKYCRVTCLHLAIKNRHYNAARFLVQHGADCNIESYDHSNLCINNIKITPISILATHKKHQWTYLTYS